VGIELGGSILKLRSTSLLALMSTLEYVETIGIQETIQDYIIIAIIAIRALQEALRLPGLLNSPE